MSTILFTTTPESGEGGARLLRTESLPALAGFTIVRSWPYIDFRSADTLFTTMEALTTVSDPYANDQQYSGTFANAQVELIEGGPDDDDRADEIRQTLIKLFSITTPTDLSGNDYLVSQEDEDLDPFSLATGNGDEISYIWRNANPANRAVFMAFSDSALVSALSLSGWTYVQRVFTEEENNTATVRILFRKVEWNAFNVASPDITYADNTSKTSADAGGENDDTEAVAITQLWFKIDISSLSGAVGRSSFTGLYKTTTGYTNYNVMQVRINGNRDGSVNIQRTLLHEAFGDASNKLEEIDLDLLNKHGLETGTLNRIRVINENLKLKTSAYLIPSEDYTKIAERQQYQGNGLWSIYRIFEAVTWTNITGTTPDQTIPRPVTSGYINTNPNTAVDGHRPGNLITATGIPSADAEEVAGNQTADSGYVIDQVVTTERGDGESAITKRQSKKLATTDNFYRRWTPANGEQEETETVRWQNLTAADATLIYNDAKTKAATMSTSAYCAAPSNHLLRSVDRLPLDNELFDVVRVTYIPKGASTWWRFDGSEDDDYWQQYFVTADDGTIYRVTKGRRIGTAENAADYANESTFRARMNNREGAFGGSVERTQVNNRYLAIREIWQDASQIAYAFGDGDFTTGALAGN